MNDHKICFIICTNHPEKSEKCIFYIQDLEIPRNYSVDIITMAQAESMAQGYQSAMEKSDAKYKIYVREDVNILYKKMLIDMIDIFESNEKIGLLGIAGYNNISKSTIMWEQSNAIGELFVNTRKNSTGKNTYCLYKKVEEPYESVKKIDGHIMITQYDIPWRADIFDGGHFYDASCSLEFIKAGYLVLRNSLHGPVFSYINQINSPHL